jgi:SHS2 domain-containing protein
MSYRFLEHATDAFIEVTAPNMTDAFLVSAISVVDLTIERSYVEEKEVKVISVRGKDLKYLLFNWLEAITYQLITEGFAIKRFEVDLQKKDQYQINAKTFGEPIDLKKHHFKVEVKAPTFHLMEILEEKEVKMRFLLDL